METLWTKEACKGLGNYVDDLIKLPAILEMFDGMLITQLVSILDARYGDKIPEKYRPIFGKVGKIFEIYNETGELELYKWLQSQELAEIFNLLIDIPTMTEEEELIVIAPVLAGIFKVLENIVKKEEDKE